MIRTGDEYRRSIQDDREIYLNGERIRDVVTHPAFKPLIDIRARIYDMAHDPSTRPVISSKSISISTALFGLPLCECSRSC